MTRQRALEELTVSLTKAIEDWINQACEREAWGEMGYHGMDEARIMARAAMTVMEGAADSLDYMRDNNMLKE